MNEHELAQRFSADVDRLLIGGARLDESPASAEYRQMLDLAARLASEDFAGQRVPALPAQRATATRVPRQGESTMTTLLRGRMRLSRALITAAAVLALALTLAPVRALAHDMLAQLGIVTVVNEPTSIELMLSEEPQAPSDPAQPTAAPPVLSEEQPYTPAYVPAGYSAEASQLGMQYVGEANGEPSYLRIYTLSPDTDRLAVGDAQVSHTTVRGREALYVQRAPLYVKDLGRPMLQHEIEPAYVDLLIWEEDGQAVVVESSALSLAELQKVAESLSR